MQSRLKNISEDNLTAQQKQLRDSILKSRGNLNGPFSAWLLSPKLGEKAQALGEVCRYHTSLNPEESELLILITASFWQCKGEWQIHHPIALQSGLPNTICKALKDGLTPYFTSDRQLLLYKIAKSTLDKTGISDTLYAQSVEIFGEKTLVEIIAIIGYYSLVAFTLNAFNMQIDK